MVPVLSTVQVCRPINVVNNLVTLHTFYKGAYCWKISKFGWQYLWGRNFTISVTIHQCAWHICTSVAHVHHRYKIFTSGAFFAKVMRHMHHWWHTCTSGCTFAPSVSNLQQWCFISASDATYSMYAPLVSNLHQGCQICISGVTFATGVSH